MILIAAVHMQKSNPSPTSGRLASKLIDDLADRIHAKIVGGDYPPGTRLKQEELANAFSVSRTPVREALSRLEGKGVVVQSQHRSAIVRVPSGREVTEMYQVRAELEGLAAELAAKWLSDEDLVALRQSHDGFVGAVEAMRQGGSRLDADTLRATSLRWIELNTAFHRTICHASGNRYLERMVQDQATGYARTIMQSSIGGGLTRSRLDANIRWHGRILSALEDRKPAKARQAMSEHIREAGELVSALFERQASS